ncbi:hypothetical protein [Acinetobacter terrestris]|uniref:DUF4375 domain-containing protein n=1 Tax=Acinetobacter terrestris TaxID=2529843 RepID=A0AAW6UW27_9GAMM|nr:hypothetical protein [Acinetobacter terrestris]MDK1683507.1 hypothetical protein [Acinetobacter terrestris]
MKHPNLEQFLKGVASHELTVNLDQGVFRDLTIMKPNSVDMHYHITTRPGYLMFTGDMGSFVFTRLPDMFNFFRDNDGYDINPGYWGEKLEAVDSRAGAKEFSPDEAKQILTEYLQDHLEGLDSGDYDKDQSDTEESKEAIQELIEIAEGDQHEFYEQLRNWDSDDAGGLDMDCWWEWDFNDYTGRYIWCCYAIVHAIKLYDAQKNKEVA